MAIYKTGNSYSDTPSVGSQELVESLGRLVPRPPADTRLDAPATPAAIRAKTGLERKVAGAINSEVVTATSTDGLFTFVVRVVKS